MRSLAALILLVACACAPSFRERTFDPGEHAVTGSGVLLELRHAQYDDRHFTLRVVFTNRGRDELTVTREGLLLAYERLEFPVASYERMKVPETIAVAPGQAVEVALPFDLPIRSEAKLRVRTLSRDGLALAPLALEIPGPPQPGL